MSRVLTLAGLLAFALLLTAPSAASAQPPAGAPAPAQAPPPPTVKVGEPMPDFTLNYLEPAPDGGRPQQKTARLSDFKGKQVVVLAFFPAAFSPG
jgi:hypothetical protein